MTRRIIEGGSVALILAGAYLTHPGLLLMVVGAVGIVLADVLERGSE